MKKTGVNILLRAYHVTLVVRCSRPEFSLFPCFSSSGAAHYTPRIEEFKQDLIKLQYCPAQDPWKPHKMTLTD